jgi:predicted DsbA family dithiol-disulfide isomerase
VQVAFATVEGMPVLEVFADVCCPFTHVGLRRFVEQRSNRARPDVVLRVRAWPLELVNGSPLDPAFVAEEVDELRAQVAADLFVGFDQSAFPASSIPAMAMAVAAYEHSDAAGEAVSLALRRALFDEGRDIADPAVLAEVGAAVGIGLPVEADDTTVRADWAEGVERGVQGSPHFFVPSSDDDDGFFCPSLDISRDDAGHLHISSDPAELTVFFDRCFA